MTTDTPISGCRIFAAETSEDERGAFVTWFRAPASAEALLIRQVAVSRNTRAGTLRGMHFQIAPSEQVKLVHCIRGRIYDVVVDTRPGSDTFGRTHALELAPGAGDGLLIPPGCAHGFITLEDDSEVLYQLSRPGDPAAARGLRWNDPGLQVQWPIEPTVMSEQDAAWPDYDWSSTGD